VNVGHKGLIHAVDSYACSHFDDLNDKYIYYIMAWTNRYRVRTSKLAVEYYCRQRVCCVLAQPSLML
jgi:hypothetical protein